MVKRVVTAVTVCSEQEIIMIATERRTATARKTASATQAAMELMEGRKDIRARAGFDMDQANRYTHLLYGYGD